MCDISLRLRVRKTLLQLSHPRTKDLDIQEKDEAQNNMSLILKPFEEFVDALQCEV